MENLSVRSLVVRLLISVTILILVLSGISYFAELYVEENVPTSLSNGFITIVIVFTSIALVKLSHIGFNYLHNSRGRLTAHQKEVSYRFIQISVYLTSLFLVVTVWNINLSNILIGAGALGILAGLAARQALSAVLSGIIIMATNMFKVGDWIQFEDKFGRVTKITFFNTHFSSQTGEKHIIPNDSLTAKNITNMSSNNKYRKDIVIGVDYDCDLDQVLDICNDELAELSSDSHQSSVVDFHPTSIKDFDTSCIELAIKVWTDNPTPMGINKTQTTVFKHIHERFDKEDIEIPFQQVTVSHREQEIPEQHLTNTQEISENENID